MKAAHAGTRNRQGRDRARRFNPRNRFQSRDDLIKKSPNDFFVLVLRFRQADAKREQIFRFDAGIHLLEFDETAHHQPRADEQNQSDRDFGDNKPIANALTANAAHGAAAAFFQNFG